MRASLLLLALMTAVSAHAQTPRKRKTPAKKAAPASRKAPMKKAAPAPAKAVETPRPVNEGWKDAMPEGEAQASGPAKPAEPEHIGTFVSPAGALGAALVETPAGLFAGEPLPGSPAETAGLKAGDRVAAVSGKPVSGAREAADALSGWPLSARFSAVALRGLGTETPTAPAPPAAAERDRAKGALSPYEKALRQKRQDAAAEAAVAALRSAPDLDFSVHSRQAFWLRFPAGIREDAVPGAIFTGETTTAVATSSDLDFLSVPPKTKVWARVLSIDASEDVRKIRLHLFKLQPSGGHAYRVSGIVTDVVGDQTPAKVTPAGTLVVAQPLERGPKPKALPLLTPEARLRAELLETVVLTEAPAFYRAGPGLWLRTKETPEGRRYEISHVIAGRSAEKAGLKVGQLVSSVGGRSASKLEFADALDALYGPAGTEVKVSIDENGKTSTLTLKRGVLYKDGAEAPVPAPYLR